MEEIVMAIAMKIASQISKSSWIRRMFEEGERLRQEFGADKIYDFTLGNPDVEPPEAFNQQLLELARNPLPGMHRYMNNAGYAETRAAVAGKISSVRNSFRPVFRRQAKCRFICCSLGYWFACCKYGYPLIT